MSALIRGFFVIALLPLFLWEMAANEIFGQFMLKDPETDQAKPMWEFDSYGPFGPRTLGKPITPTYPNSRFQGAGATFGANGEFLGYDINAPNARFQPYWQKEPFNTLDYFPNRGNQRTGPTQAIAARNNNPTIQSDLAGPVFRTTRRPGNSMLSVAPGAPLPGQPSEILQRPGGNITEERWFRDRPGGNSSMNPGYYQGNTPGNQGNAAGSNPENRQVGPARPIGGDAFRPQFVQPNPQNSGQPVPQGAMNQSRIQAIERQLEEALIMSAVVHPLSPIEVVISNGTATVRGVVPNQAAKTEAEVIILANPIVNTVNNRLSVLNE